MAKTLREQIKVFVDANLSPAAQRARFAAAARKARDELIASGRASPIYQTFRDGAEASTEEGATRTISYRYQYIGDAVEFALFFLRDRSPVDRGDYRNAFMVAINGRPVKAANFVKRSVPPGAEVFVYNPLPYSRKIDVQLSGRRKLKYSVRPGLFDDAARAVRGRFGNSVKASRLYTIRFPGQKTSKHTGRVIDSPALVIRGLE